MAQELLASLSQANSKWLYEKTCLQRQGDSTPDDDSAVVIMKFTRSPHTRHANHRCSGGRGWAPAAA